jgi:hypothetical protein
VIGGFQIVAEEARRLVAVPDDHVEIAVVIDVADCEAA